MMQIHIPQDPNDAKHLARLCSQSKLRRIYHGIYTDDLETPIEEIIQLSWMKMIAHIVPDGILSFRTAIDLKPISCKNAKEKIIFVTGAYVKTIQLPGLIVKVIKGDSHAFKEPILPNLSRSNFPRVLLENLTVVRNPDYQGVKTVGEEGIQDLLAKELMLRKEDGLNQVRDQAKIIAEQLNYKREFKILNAIVCALLSTHSERDILKTPYARSIARKQPFDQKRLTSFEKLSVYLKRCSFKQRSFVLDSMALRHLSFFESYFSNFIEGTEFEIDEAEDIVFSGKEINHRHADSHDVLSNFYLTNDALEMLRTPGNPQELIDILKSRHAFLMKERPEKRPGVFKNKINKAGNTHFVHPDEVIGTLCQSFEYYQALDFGLQRALFMQFVVSEIHPFDDGNGRLSRIMMNAELFSAGCYKVIIPTVHRDNYLNGLRLASRHQEFQIFCKVLDQAQAYTESVHWREYNEARKKIQSDHADKTADEGLPIFYRAIRALEMSVLPPN